MLLSLLHEAGCYYDLPLLLLSEGGCNYNLPLLLLPEAGGETKVANLHSHRVREEEIAQLEIPG